MFLLCFSGNFFLAFIFSLALSVFLKFFLRVKKKISSRDENFLVFNVFRRRAEILPVIPAVRRHAVLSAPKCVFDARRNVKMDAFCPAADVRRLCRRSTSLQTPSGSDDRSQ